MQRKDIEALDQQIQGLQLERRVQIEELQESCPHPPEECFQRDGWQGMTRYNPPQVLCRQCGLVEQCWGPGNSTHFKHIKTVLPRADEAYVGKYRLGGVFFSG